MRRWPRAAVAEAEARLGFPLPAEHRSLLEEFGSFSVHESFFMPPAGLYNAYDQMIKEWGSPAESLASLPEPTRLLLKAGVILFTEAGDGYGALLYLPSAIRSAPAGAELRAGYYWIHQDTLAAPELLTNPSGLEKSYSEAFVWLMAQSVFALYELPEAEAVLFDGSAAHPVPYLLEDDPSDTGFLFRIRIDWEHFN